jgi:hypothetical protein
MKFSGLIPASERKERGGKHEIRISKAAPRAEIRKNQKGTRESTKSQARNPKQFQMTKNKCNVPNKTDSDSPLWIFRG